ncbi:hypothetical protein ANN_01847 [Periplaneta americana]|uniref:Pre-mRNA-processing factor 39 n=1 Tax=Periplaneta americana TaxID=6978 RepID=A0ABQ8TX37_PERAM|nr:hypothetical protein ANN_01847 [Periplaneta americana]
MERVNWTDRIRNEVVLERVGEERMMLKLIRKRKRNWLGHWVRRNCLLKDALEGMMNRRRVLGRRRYQMTDDIKIYVDHMQRLRRKQNMEDGECWVCSERPVCSRRTRATRAVATRRSRGRKKTSTPVRTTRSKRSTRTSHNVGSDEESEENQEEVNQNLSDTEVTQDNADEQGSPEPQKEDEEEEEDGDDNDDDDELQTTINASTEESAIENGIEEVNHNKDEQNIDNTESDVKDKEEPDDSCVVNQDDEAEVDNEVIADKERTEENGGAVSDSKAESEKHVPLEEESNSQSIDEKQVPELEDSPPPSVSAAVQPSPIRSGLRLKSAEASSVGSLEESQGLSQEGDVNQYTVLEETNMSHDSGDSANEKEKKSADVKEKEVEEEPIVKEKEKEPVVKEEEEQPVVKEEKKRKKKKEPVVKEKKEKEPVVKEKEPVVKEKESVVKEKEPIVKEKEPVVKEKEPVKKVKKEVKQEIEEMEVETNGTAAVQETPSQEELDGADIKFENVEEMTVIDEVTEEDKTAGENGAMEQSGVGESADGEGGFRTEPDTEMVSEDELPTETSKEPLETEAVSDEELPDPTAAVDLPETEAVSEDELPPEKTDKKKKKAAAKQSSASGKKKARSLEAQKRKLMDGDTYDPSSPTSENSCDESPAAKRAAVASAGGGTQAKPVTKTRKSLPELEKYWKAVKEDPSDFTGWTYLLQYVDQELYESPDIITSIKIARLRWAGHVKRMDECEIPRKVMEYGIAGGRRVGRTGGRWLKIETDGEEFLRKPRTDPGCSAMDDDDDDDDDDDNDIEAAREAYDAFLSHYPYCYGYWRKYADYEKRKGNKEKCEEVFERGLKAIPLSVDLWIHFLNYSKATYPDDEEHLRTQFEKAISACGMEFRHVVLLDSWSDRLWESYIKWENEAKRLQNVTNLYDRLLAMPTQGYTNHFDNFQEHISSNPPQKVLSVDEFLTLRREVLQLLKQYDQPTTVADDVAPGEEVEAPPGEEPDEQPVVKTDEETTALRERIISIRRKVHKVTVTSVADRWNFEEGIKRPYFHVKPLERCQLKNWKEYLDYEIEQGDQQRIIVLFERCLIACALYEEFWIKFIRYLESLKGDLTDKIRNVYERACTIHHTKKPNLHLHWAVFEESHSK